MIMEYTGLPMDAEFSVMRSLISELSEYPSTFPLAFHVMSGFNLCSYCAYVQSASKPNISGERSSLLSAIDGEVFYPLRSWPLWVKRLFWSKPLTDTGTFQITLYLVGNGCPPDIVAKWVLCSQHWASNMTDALSKRRRQLTWILDNMDAKGKEWFYFDLHHNLYLSLDGDKRKPL